MGSKIGYRVIRRAVAYHKDGQRVGQDGDSSWLQEGPASMTFHIRLYVSKGSKLGD